MKLAFVTMVTIMMLSISVALIDSRLILLIAILFISATSNLLYTIVSEGIE